MAKHTYEYVKNYINEKSNGECQLLSTEYVNSTTPLALKCKCGNIFYKSFNKCKNGFFVCKDCLNKIRSKKYRNDFQSIIEYINSTGCEYVSGNYTNSNSLLTIRCKCGDLFQKNYTHFKCGQQQCPKCGAESSRQSRFKYNKDDVIKILSKKGITLLSDYIDSYHYIDCICSKGHKFTTKLQLVLYNKFGCQQCSKEFQIGENANHYKGGESEVLDNFRKIIKGWKVEVAKKYNYVCALTGAKYDCVVHHLKPFRQIIDESCKELNLPLYRKLKDYSPEDYKKLESLILKKHTLDVGILLQRKVHKKFHSLYGIRNNTIEQFEEFIKNYYPQFQLNKENRD